MENFSRSIVIDGLAQSLWGIGQRERVRLISMERYNSEPVSRSLAQDLEFMSRFRASQREKEVAVVSKA